ncbi:replication initiation protein Rep [Streptococcus infantarius subsp. infantarius]|nr:replication initiation protein Rep [Streptococcus infantarius subsp. infantarius]
MVFNAITVEQYETSERYFKLPKLLFESPRYEDVRLDSKVSYSILKDRLSLSLKNNWVDEEGRIYLVYSNSKLMKILNCSKSTLLRIKKQLAEYGLMQEVQQSSSEKGTLANKIYLGNLVVDDSFSIPNEDDIPPVSNLNQGGVKKTLGGCQNNTGLVSNSAPSETEYNETEYSDYISSRKPDKNSNEFSQSAETNQSSSQNQLTTFVEQKYYSLLQVIADKYNEQMFGFPDVLTMTHNQKMKIGQYLASGYVTSAEVLNMIERIPKDSTSPLAYLLKSLENLKQERLYEQKSIAHLNAENYYIMKKEGDENV